MRRTFPNLLLVGLLATGGCVHKVSIQQGNYLDDETVARVEEGMTREQVKYPAWYADGGRPVPTDRWDYVYYFSNGRTGACHAQVRRHLLRRQHRQTDRFEGRLAVLWRPTHSLALRRQPTPHFARVCFQRPIYLHPVALFHRRVSRYFFAEHAELVDGEVNFGKLAANA